MLLFIGIVLAVFVLPSPWGLVAVGIGAALEIAETSTFIWWSKRRKASVGVESLVGKRGVAVDALWPDGTGAGERRDLEGALCRRLRSGNVGRRAPDRRAHARRGARVR